MLPSIDSYLHHEIETKMKIILSNRYIIEEVLKGIQTDVSRNFMRAYCGETGREVPIVYTMPQDKVTQQGAIYIGLREGQESRPSIGNIEDTYDFKEGNLIEGASLIHHDKEKNLLYLEVEEEIGELISVEGLQFAKADNKYIESNKIYFKYDPDLVGLGPFVVNYISKEGEGEVGLQKGFTTTEHYSVLAVSTNMDTVRCLDLIIKAILIMMRDNQEEQNNHLLQRLQFGQIEEIDTGRTSGDGESPEILYGRETIVTYTTSYTLDVPLLDRVKSIEERLRLDV